MSTIGLLVLALDIEVDLYYSCLGFAWVGMKEPRETYQGCRPRFVAGIMPGVLQGFLIWYSQLPREVW